MASAAAALRAPGAAAVLAGFAAWVGRLILSAAALRCRPASGAGPVAVVVAAVLGRSAKGVPLVRRRLWGLVAAPVGFGR